MANGGPVRPSILLIAGDVSGDVQTAALARALLQKNPKCTLHALGGKRLMEIVEHSPGGQFLGDTTDCSAIGIVSAIRIILRCRRLGYRLLEFLRMHRVDLAVLCDWGAFNGRLLPRLQALGIPILYYFPPRSWERRSSAGLGIVPYVTRVATPFRWSAERLRRAGARADWVGHPSLENVPKERERAALRSKFHALPDEKLVALLPGSRRSEIHVLAPRMAKAVSIIKKQIRARFIAVVPRELAEEAKSHLPSSIEIVSDCAKQLLFAADAAIVKTGTGTLEAALSDTPQVAVYDVSLLGRIEWTLLWAWRRIPFIAMPNIILQRRAVPELIGLHCQPARIAESLIQILADSEARDKMLWDYALIRQALGSELTITPTQRTAQIVEEMLTETTREVEEEPVAV